MPAINAANANRSFYDSESEPKFSDMLVAWSTRSPQTRDMAAVTNLLYDCHLQEKAELDLRGYHIEAPLPDLSSLTHLRVIRLDEEQYAAWGRRFIRPRGCVVVEHRAPVDTSATPPVGTAAYSGNSTQ